MLLIWSCARDETVAWFETMYLRSSRLTWTRFDTEQFPENISLTITPSTFVWSHGAKRCGPEDIHCVWYRKPMASEFTLPLRSVEIEYAQNEAAKTLIAMRDLLQSAVWMNWPERNELASRKLRQLQDASEAGFTCPDTLVSNESSEIISFAEKHGDRLLVKPLHRGTIVENEKRRAFYSTLLSVDDLARDPVSLTICPLIYQQFIAKAFELRVTVVDRRCFAVRLDSQDRACTAVDWRRDPYGMRHSAFALPAEIAERCIRLTRNSGLLFTAFDLIVTPDGEYVFLEHNPNGQFAWLEQLAGVPIGQAMLEFFCQFSARP